MYIDARQKIKAMQLSKKQIIIFLTMVVFFLGKQLYMPSFALAQSTEEQIDEVYQHVKLAILCETLDFLIHKIEENATGTNLDCRDFSSLQNNIPKDALEAHRIFTVFESKLYKSYGKDKLKQRLNKLLKDLETELRKSRKGQDWKENINALMLRLKIIKNDYVHDWEENKIKPQTSRIYQEKEKIQESQENNNPYQITTQMWIVIIIMFLVSLAGLGFLYKQNQEMKEMLASQEEVLLEKYARIDHRIDTMTPARDYQALLLKFNFLNEQLAALVHEVQILQKRNEHKMSAEELYAKRTEHLESYNFNPNLQIYFAKIRPNSTAFEAGDLKTEPSRDSIYKIEINLKSPNQAVFSILIRSEYHHLALQHADKMLAPACQYANEPYNDSRIVNIENGILERKEEKWVILKKAKIAFE